MTTELEQLAERYVAAYNAADYDTLNEVLDENVRMRHHNRGVDVTGRDPNVDQMRAFAGIIPDRGFTDRVAITQIGDDQVLVRHVWGGLPVQDVPGFATAGEPLAITLATFMTFSEGRLVDYQDYG